MRIWNPHSHPGYKVIWWYFMVLVPGVLGVAESENPWAVLNAVCIQKHFAHVPGSQTESFAKLRMALRRIPFHTNISCISVPITYHNINVTRNSLPCGSLRLDKLWYAVIPRMPWWHSIAIVAKVSEQLCCGNEPAGWPWFNQNLFLLPLQGSPCPPAMLWELSSLREFIAPWSSRVSKMKETSLRAGILPELWMRERLTTMKLITSNIRDVRHRHHGKTRYTNRTSWSERAKWCIAVAPLCTRRLSCWQNAHRHCRWYSPSFKAKNFQKSSGQSTGLWRRRCTRRLQLSALKQRRKRKWRSQHQSPILKPPSHRPPWCGDGTWQGNTRPEQAEIEHVEIRLPAI